MTHETKLRLRRGLVFWLCLMTALMGDPLLAVQENLRFDPPTLTVPADWEWYDAARDSLGGWQSAWSRLDLSELVAPSPEPPGRAELASPSSAAAVGQTSSAPEDEELRRLVEQDQVAPEEDRALHPPQVPEDLLLPGSKRATAGEELALPPDLVRLMTEKADLDRIPVVPGWNLLSVPEEPADTDPAAVLAPIAGSYTRAYAYDACDTADPWKVHDPADPGVSDLAAIDHKIGFWLEGSAAADLPSDGTLSATTTFDLCVGWNLIGFPAGEARPVTNALYTLEGKYLRVFGYDVTDPADPWEVYSVGVPDWANDLRIMEPGRGYWVLVTEPATLEIANQGPDPVVEIAAPADLDVVTTFTDVVGTVRSPILESWVLTYRMIGEGDPVTLAEGVTPVELGVLGVLDPTLLLNGLYELKLEATDLAGRVVEETLAVSIEGGLKLGIFTISFVDLAIPVSGLDLQIVRTYDSRARNETDDFGFGWSLEISQGSYRNNRKPGEGWRIEKGFLPCERIRESKTHLTTIRLSDREVYKFRTRLSSPAPSLGGCFARAGFEFVDGPIPGATLQIVGSNEVFWENGSDRVFEINSFTIFEPEAVRLTTRDGRAFYLDLDLGVTRLEDSNGNSIDISASGIEHSSGKTVGFERDGAGRIVGITDPNGLEMRYSYEPSGNLKNVVDRSGESTQFVYIQNHYLEEIVDPRGVKAVRSDYDESGRLIRVTDASGNPVDLNHDLDNRREVITDRLGQSRVLEYDTRGNVIKETDPLGGVTVRTFDGEDHQLTETNPLGHKVTNQYNNDGDLLSTTDSLGNTTTYSYDSQGHILTLTDPRGQVTSRAYNAAGNLIKNTDPLGHETHFSYDSSGNLTSVTDSLDHLRSYSYDSSGNLAREIDPLGGEKTYSYDDNGNLLTSSMVRTLEDGQQEILTTSFSYDSMDRIVETILPDGSAVRTSYNPIGDVTEVVDALGRSRQIAYDARGNRISTLLPDGTSEQRRYDAENHLIEVTDLAGRSTFYSYDALGRIVSSTSPDGSQVANTFDAAGNLTSTTDERGAITSFVYDAGGRRVRLKDPLGNETQYTYDRSGNQTSVTDSLGHVTSYEYDAVGRLIKTLNPDGTTREQVYDAVGNRVDWVDEAGVTTTFNYDGLGRLVGVVDADGGFTEYKFNELGQRVSQTDPKGQTTRFSYDPRGRVTSRVLPGGATETKVWDAANNLISYTDFKGRTTSFTYDSRHRLLERRRPDGSRDAFAYAPSGQRVSATDARGTTTWEYDDLDRPIRHTYPDGRELRYSYDEAGNRTEVAAELSSGATFSTRYQFDLLGRLTAVVDPEGRNYSIEIDPVGNRKSLSYPNGITTTYDYDQRNRLIGLNTENTEAAEIIQNYQYDLAVTGHKLRVEELDGTVRAYSYDLVYRLLSESVTGARARQETFGYDAFGNRVSRTVVAEDGTSTETSYSYDTRDRLVAEGSIQYQWDDNGNLISKGNDSVFSWDDRNKLTDVFLESGARIRYAYDTDGVRVKAELVAVEGEVTARNFLVDTSGALSQVVAETDNNGDLLAYYVRAGSELLAVLRPSGDRFFHADGQDTVRALTNEVGEVTDRYQVSAFGELLEHSGTDGNDFLFAGEMFDTQAELYYLRARWMDPTTGRFVSSDPFQGDPYQISSLHRYSYAGNDGINSRDPSGEFTASIGSLTITISISNILSGMAIGAITGAIFGAADAYFAETSITDGIVQGALVGAFLGPLGKIKILSRFLIYVGTFLSATSAYQAYMDGDTGLALFRGILFVAGLRAALTSGIPSGFPGKVPTPPPAPPNTGNVAVYRSVNPATGEVQYVGITKNLVARAAAHLRQKGIVIQEIKGLLNLSRSDARAVEQVLIEFYGLGKNGGSLVNKINSISQTNPIYSQALARGQALLASIGYPGF